MTVAGREAPARPIQRCASCGHELPDTAADVVCPVCGGLLDLALPTPRVGGGELRAQWDDALREHAGASDSAASGVWRFRDVVFPGSDAPPVSHPEGNTPLLRRDAVAAWAGVPRLLLKHEGHNPTGSFKDRGMTVALTQARRVGARAVACASTGNTSSSLASYAALAGLPALVVVPAGRVAVGKLAQTTAYGATVALVRGDFDDCLRLVREASRALGVYLVNSVNPFRLEGQKTIVLELLQQLRWAPPDWIALPAGNLGNTAAFGKALRELLAWGVIDRVPRLAAVQAAGAAPFAASFADEFRVRHRVNPETVASAIRIGDPASYDRAVRAVRETRGVVLAVPDADILEAKAVIDASGVGCEPASAASVAGARALRAAGVIGAGERVAAVLTGHLLKDPDAVFRPRTEGADASRRHRPSPPVEIPASIDALAALLSRD